MTITRVTDTDMPEWYSSYIFECCCGERFNNVGAASVCKKCRNYSVWGYTKYVINIKTDEVVYGELPSEEEYAEAAARAEKRWEQEQKDWEADWCDELAEEIRQEWWDQLDAEEAELEEDQAWDIQEKLMK